VAAQVGRQTTSSVRSSSSECGTRAGAKSAIYVWLVAWRQVLRVALATNNAVVADGANITVSGVRVSVTALSGYSAPHTGMPTHE